MIYNIYQKFVSRNTPSRPQPPHAASRSVFLLAFSSTLLQGWPGTPGICGSHPAKDCSTLFSPRIHVFLVGWVVARIEKTHLTFSSKAILARGKASSSCGRFQSMDLPLFCVFPSSSAFLAQETAHFACILLSSAPWARSWISPTLQNWIYPSIWNWISPTTLNSKDPHLWKYCGFYGNNADRRDCLAHLCLANPLITSYYGTLLSCYGVGSIWGWRGIDSWGCCLLCRLDLKAKLFQFEGQTYFCSVPFQPLGDSSKTRNAWNSIE